MEEFKIKSAVGSSSISFIERVPSDPTIPIRYYTVRLQDGRLDAAARVDAWLFSDYLIDLLRYVAENWQAFRGPKEWSSMEGEFLLQISHDGRGHFSINTDLSSGIYPPEWNVKSSVLVETSQLDRLVFELSEFIGAHQIT